MNGYAGYILRVNLTTGEIRKESLDLDVARSFIGGLGVNSKLGYDLIKPGVDPLSPENLVIIGAGPLVGTNAPGSSRVVSLTKLPVNGAIGWGSGGGMNFGCMLKHAGYDHIVIGGRAKKPVYLKIFDDDVEICDAESLWGKGAFEVVDELYSKYGRPLGVISIGQGGENKVKFALAFIEKLSTLGRGGLGAVLGSKNLKAIIAKGTKGIGVFDRERYRALVEQIYGRMRKWPGLKDAQKYGSLPEIPEISREDYIDLLKARLACVSCPIGDKELLQAKKGKFKGFTKYTTHVHSPVTQPLIYGITSDYGEAAKLLHILDEYGLDRYETYEPLRFANELYKHQIISEEDLGTPGVRFDYDSLAEWFRKIAYREGFGNVLADGFKGIFQKYGKQTEEFSPAVARGMAAYEGITGPVYSDLLTTFEFGMAVHPRGPAAAFGSSPLYRTRGRPADWVKGHLDRAGVPPDAIERIFIPKEGMAVNVGRMEKWGQQYALLLDALGMCGVTRINRFYSTRLQAELYSVVTGVETSKEELMKAAEIALNLLKAANVREGFTRKDDRFPEIWFGEKKYKDYYEKIEITREIAYGLLDDYYDELGWDIETGTPTKRKLIELGLDYVINDAEKIGIKYV